MPPAPAGSTPPTRLPPHQRRPCSQVYGLSPSELLDPDFRFASIERADVAVPLLDVLEGLTSDAGGEVQKGGGVIETVAPDAAWRHCATHGLNLTLEKSVCFEHVGASVRSISSFCRGGNKHSTLVLHMMRIQKPSLASDDASCDKRLSDM